MGQITKPPARPIAHCDLAEVERQVCQIAAEQLALTLDQVHPESRVVEDLRCDSLDFVELLLSIEEHFGVTLPDRDPDPVYKAVFTRAPFTLRDIAELVCLRSTSGPPDRRDWSRAPAVAAPASEGPMFSQLGGQFTADSPRYTTLYEPLGPNIAGFPQYRRLTDGMRCVRVPGATAVIGSEPGSDTPADEQPRHRVELSDFLMDAEPVSTTAYARFLNSIGEVDDDVLRVWFLLDDADRRHDHAVLERTGMQWRPIAGTETWPMILVSWYGASAYSLWAHGRDWRDYERQCMLPNEAQWEYAARGTAPARYPWGDREPLAGDAVYGQHRRGATYRLHDLPLAPVNAWRGMSPFGLHHMAGNVWQWCRDWYEVEFYRQPQAGRANACNTAPTGVRSERGGSWIGPATLIRSSFRRGRAPHARGRCLGFRCAAHATHLA